MTTLTGSDKQIAWATTIRARIMDEMVACRSECAAEYPAAVGAVDAAIAALDAQTDAGWWIDRKDCTSRAVERAHIARISPFAAMSKAVEAIVTGA